ncbi:winged helix-turn-helix transcriptional regulator [Yinghuangia sp. YIM S09857]|uniref:winged helix-turn-helix transcriptional regulator n=1 Tax=Yinghuangia sp. YIM S09857 TaxID=3436929 RepID=UPI003F531D28
MSEPTTHLVEYDPYGAFEADCPARFATELFANTWLPVIVYVLRDGPMRPGELRTAIGGISQKVLTQTLRRMERLTLVTRRRYAEAPPRVEYELTPAGRDLLAPILALGVWADRHGAAVTAAMDQEDSEDSEGPVDESTRIDGAGREGEAP